MKLGSFRVHRANSVREALEMRVEYGDDAAFYAGGTELLLVMKLGLADYPHLIDLKRVAPLTQLAVVDSEIRIGAAVPYRHVIHDPDIGRAFPALVEMIAGIGNLRVRSTGTVGGNLAFADPHSDPLTFLMAAGASVDVVAADGTIRNIDIDELTLAPFTTVLEPTEMLSTIRVPVPPPGRRFVHKHIRFRERPALTVTAAADVEGDDLGRVRLVVGAVEGVPRRIDAAERLVATEGLGRIDDVKGVVSEIVQPTDDLDGSAEYKRHLAGVFAARAFQELAAGRGA